jgi:hypothetical protein
MEAFSDAVVASEAPHGHDFQGPGGESLTELDQLGQAGLTATGEPPAGSEAPAGAEAAPHAIQSDSLTRRRHQPGDSGSFQVRKARQEIASIHDVVELHAAFPAQDLHQLF